MPMSPIFYNAHVANIDNIIEGSPTIEFDDTGSEVKVIIRAEYDFLFMGQTYSRPVMENNAVSNYGGDYVPPFSVAFVFDVSGSMGWRTADGKIRVETLKQSVTQFFSTLYTRAKNPDSVRQAMSTSYATYNTGLVDSGRMAPGDAHVLLGSARMRPGGGTNSTPGVVHAYNQLCQTERTAEAGWTGYVIFMTDGDNNRRTWDTSTLRTCTRMKSAGYEVYTVAFGAPNRAKRMLEDCASDSDHFLDASVATEMTKAFEDIGADIVKSIVRVKS